MAMLHLFCIYNPQKWWLPSYSSFYWCWTDMDSYLFGVVRLPVSSKYYLYLCNGYLILMTGALYDTKHLVKQAVWCATPSPYSVNDNPYICIYVTVHVPYVIGCQTSPRIVWWYITLLFWHTCEFPCWNCLIASYGLFSIYMCICICTYVNLSTIYMAK